MTERRPGAPPPAEAERPDLSCPQPAAVFGSLFDAHAAALHRYLARRVGAGAADDLVSETFLVALQRRHSYDPARAAVRSWLYGIATNLLRGHLRAEVRGYQATARAAARQRPEDGHDGRVAAMVDAEAATLGLAAALAGLAPGDRDVLLLTSWAGLDSTEVAEALDIPVGTVRSRLHRVRRELRAHAPDHGKEDPR
ncbi:MULTISPECIES: RNA polymerase sigma factor [unclassified Crossiella]|uniref:RNA polymerase sigma factor n=1 Tax=Crossiella sp. CA-258035 TaxID=2981138 RepID=UPI0024BCE6D1|nr:RNA polymerase sigma factor [Crossiella sp. CA-258035]WHT19863.1 RNA polymerase sigma factor [Crossiella sp. CA-258035]